MMNDHPLRILLLEDSPTDAELAERELRRAGLHPVLLRVETHSDFVRELHAFNPDVIVADYNLPGFDGLEALSIVRAELPEMPFIIFSGSLGDERAVAVLKEGANDYVLKDRMHRLPSAILRARQDALDRLERLRMGRELRDEKEFIARVIDTTTGLVTVLDTEGQIVRSNASAARVTGLSNEELIGRLWDFAFPSDSPVDIRQVMEDTFAGRAAQFEVTLVTAAGSRRTIVWQSSAIHQSTGSPQYLVLTGIDLTEMRQMELQLEQARRIDSLGRVAATVAHEFNNLLMMIGSAAEMLRKGPDNAATVAERIEQAVLRGTRITQEVTRFVRPAEPAPRLIEVNAWILGLAGDARRLLRTVVLDVIVLSTDACILCDPEQLYQVLSNLVVNARDAIGGEGRITLTVDDVEQYVRFTVHDTGPGIPADVLPHIFEPFYTTKRTGTGLGLAVSFQTIVAHGGQIYAESSGSGATFYVLLPRA